MICHHHAPAAGARGAAAAPPPSSLPSRSPLPLPAQRAACCGARAPAAATSSQRSTQRSVTARSSAKGDGPSPSGNTDDTPQPEQSELDVLRAKYFPAAGKDGASSREHDYLDFSLDALDVVNPISLGRQARRIIDDTGVPVDNVNPIVLGRQARRAFDEVWTQLSQLASPTKRSVYDTDMEMEPMGERPAAATTVLVLGATGRVGRILTRKLLLRGYKVQALVRRRAESRTEGRTEGQGQGQGRAEAVEVEGVPEAVKVVFGDVGEMRDCQAAVRGVSKVIFCAAARSTFTGDLSRVEESGVKNMVKAFQDEILRQTDKSQSRNVPGQKRRLFTSKSKKELADFSRPYHQERWNISFLGVSEEEAASQSERSREMAKYNQAIAEINDEENLVFEGVLYQRGAAAEVGAPLASLMPGGEHRTASTEGIVLRLRGDGKQYTCVIKTDDGQRYSVRFLSRTGYTHVRLPWDTFRAERSGAPPLQADKITYFGLRYEFKRSAARLSRSVPTTAEIEEMKKERQFQLEVDWIKALPGGQEPDFILVSRAGGKAAASLLPSAAVPVAAGGQPAASPTPSAAAAGLSASWNDAVKVVEFKRRGEEMLRLSGLGYTIVRPGPLVEEPGGYKALVFDQGDRITESIAAADVADICLRALHEPAARNKTFDVCYEDQSEAGNEMYELVAHVPDRSNNYLQTAVSSLVKNT